MTKMNLPQTATASNATIDWSVLETLRSYRKQGGPDPCIRLITIFLDSSPALLKAMHTALQTADPESLAQAAHSMKSGSLNMGATALSGFCAQLEKIGRSAVTEEAGDLFARVELEYAAVETAFGKFVSENEN